MSTLSSKRCHTVLLCSLRRREPARAFGGSAWAHRPTVSSTGQIYRVFRPRDGGLSAAGCPCIEPNIHTLREPLVERDRERYGAAIVKLRDCAGEDAPAVLVAVKRTV